MYQTFKLNENNPTIEGYEWKPNNAIAVVCLIHGIGEYASRYDRIGEIFNREAIALCSMDLRGHGFSTGKKGHTAPRNVILQDVDKLIQYAVNEYPGLPLILYGHSMGGNIVLDYRRRGNFRNLPIHYIITSPWIILAREIPNYLYQIVKLLAKVKPDFLINTNIKNEELGNKEIISKQDHRQLMHGKISVKTAMEGFEIGKNLLDESLYKNRKEELKPFLLMHGDADQVCSVEGSRDLAKLEKNLCSYIEWKGLYHEIHNGSDKDDGTEVILTMVDWIKSNLSEYFVD